MPEGSLLTLGRSLCDYHGVEFIWVDNLRIHHLALPCQILTRQDGNHELIEE